jgi:hypothetical protein
LILKSSHCTGNMYHIIHAQVLYEFCISFLYPWIDVLNLNQLLNIRAEIWEPFKMKLIWGLQSWTLIAMAIRKFKIIASLSTNSAMNEGKADRNHYDCWWKPKPQVIPESEVVRSRSASLPSLFTNNKISCWTYECPIPCNCAYPCQDEPGLFNTYTNPCCRGCEFWAKKQNCTENITQFNYSRTCLN